MCGKSAKKKQLTEEVYLAWLWHCQKRMLVTSFGLVHLVLQYSLDEDDSSGILAVRAEDDVVFPVRDELQVGCLLECLGAVEIDPRLSVTSSRRPTLVCSSMDVKDDCMMEVKWSRAVYLSLPRYCATWS